MKYLIFWVGLFLLLVPGCAVLTKFIEFLGTPGGKDALDEQLTGLAAMLPPPWNWIVGTGVTVAGAAGTWLGGRSVVRAPYGKLCGNPFEKLDPVQVKRANGG